MYDMFIKLEYGEFCKLDLHGKTIEEACSELIYAIDSADIKYNGVLVIHGYNSGTSLKNFVRNTFNHKLIDKKIKVDAGRTLLILKR